MIEKRIIVAILVVVFSVTGIGFCQDMAEDWGDFLHYAAIGRFDLAYGYAGNIIESKPDAVELLALSEENPVGYGMLLAMPDSEELSEELRDASRAILDIIEQGRFIRRTEPKIIIQEIRRLSDTIRAQIAAQQRLKNAGEYAIPYMLNALADPSRQNEFANIIAAIPKIGRDAIRSLAAALQTDNVAVKAEIIRALGEIGYRQVLGYLKYVAEKDQSAQLRGLATESINKINPSVMSVPAAQLLFQLGESYYTHAESLAPAADYDFANIWFWDATGRKLYRQEVSKDYFHELMAMQACELALKADENTPHAIALWLAAFFKAESTGLEHPRYFGPDHMDAMNYATTAGPEYLLQALERALNDKNAYVSHKVVEALAANAGPRALLEHIGTQQPLVKALSFDDTSVKYSAAIALASAGPSSDFPGSNLIVENLAAAVGRGTLAPELADEYAIRAAAVMLKLAVTQNRVVDLSQAQSALIDVTKGSFEQLQILACQVLARLDSPDAQRAIAQMALSRENDSQVRVSAFECLAVSAKLNGNLLADAQIDAIYSLVSSGSGDTALRSQAASAYGALNLPSRRVKDLILDQAKN